ncbi:MAG: KH domain-containing protein, partial [Clostridia bacterium]|nr:KH domain-containing protein [Clostridia bacterium]
MVELVKYIAQSLVEKPEAVDVREVETEDSIVIELRVDPEDMGKV